MPNFKILIREHVIRETDTITVAADDLAAALEVAASHMSDTMTGVSREVEYMHPTTGEVFKREREMYDDEGDVIPSR